MITLEELCSVLNAETLVESHPKDFQIEEFCCTELMSDVLAFTHNGDRTALITALSNAQALRTAEMVDIGVVVIVRGKSVDPKIVELARDGGITLLRTRESMFTAAGKLYQYLR